MSCAAAQIVEREQGCLRGETFGSSHYVLYESFSPEQAGDEPYLLMWLHGADGGGIIPRDNLRTMQRRLQRRMFFLVPVSPQPASDGRRFLWGVSYTKSQNKNGYGHVFGELNVEYLEALSGLARQVAERVGASRVLVSGYSMGGFGAYQLGCHAPDLFDAVIPVAGYGMGTEEPPDSSCGAPQPESRAIFSKFLSEHVSKLSAVRVLFVIHAPSDSISSFQDAQRMVATVTAHGGHAVLAEVPEHAANSDPSRKKKAKLGHHYFNYALLHDTSEQVLYAPLRDILSGGEGDFLPGSSSHLEPPDFSSLDSTDEAWWQSPDQPSAALGWGSSAGMQMWSVPTGAASGSARVRSRSPKVNGIAMRGSVAKAFQKSASAGPGVQNSAACAMR